jgi:hypothetical protein
MSSSAADSMPTGPAGGAGPAGSPRVGMFLPFDLLDRGQDTARAFLAQAGQAGIDHVCCGAM